MAGKAAGVRSQVQKVYSYLSPPVLFLGLAVLAFGIQALWLGYYLDDWVVVYHLFRGGFERLSDYSFQVNRPYGAWPWWIGYLLAGFSPLKWQLWGLVWRWLTSVLLWWSWKEIWPERKLQISLAVALFTVSPVFVQQSSALTFSDHWMCFALYALSVLLMVVSLRRRRWNWPLTGLALLAAGLQLFAMEYFVGLEMVRPVLLWFLLCGIDERKQRLKQALLAELPYALLLGGFLAWRFLLMPTGGADRNAPQLFLGLLSHPLPTLVDFAIKGLRDVVEVLAGAWYKTYQPAAIAIAPISSLVSWAVALLGFLLSLAFFSFQGKKEPEIETGGARTWEWIGVNFLVMIGGFLPAWVIDQHLVSGGNYTDRFGLAAMFGASLLSVSLASFLLRQKHRLLLICLLLGLAAGYHFRLGNSFRWGWEGQSRLARQLRWRVPGLLPGTAVFGDGILATGSWVDVAWINFLYGRPGNRAVEDAWYYDLHKFGADGIPQPGQTVSEKRLELLSFQGNTSDSLVVQFRSVEHQCLWVVSEDSLPNPHLNPLVEAALPLANLERITLEDTRPSHLAQVYGAGTEPDWCYFFEKADLAAQQQEWGEVYRLWQEVKNRGLKTGVAAEYAPFLYGLAMAGELHEAVEISQRAKSIDREMQEPICQIWQQVFASAGSGQDLGATRQEVKEKLGCE